MYVLNRINRGLHNGELAPYPDDNDGDDWHLADMRIESHVDVHASRHREFDALCQQCCLINVAVPGNATAVFSLTLKNLNSATDWDYAEAAKAVELKRLHVVG